MDRYFERLTLDLEMLNWPMLERAAREEFGVEPNDYDDRAMVIQACVAVEQYAAFS